MEISRALTKVLSRYFGGNTWGLLYVGKKGREMKKIAGSSGLPTSSPHRVGLLSGICWTKNKNPRYSPMGVGAGGVVTND